MSLGARRPQAQRQGCRTGGRSLSRRALTRCDRPRVRRQRFHGRQGTSASGCADSPKTRLGERLSGSCLAAASWRTASRVWAADGCGATSWRLGIPPASPHDEHCGARSGATDSSAKRTRTRRDLYFQPGQTILELAAGPAETGFLAAEQHAFRHLERDLNTSTRFPGLDEGGEPVVEGRDHLFLAHGEGGWGRATIRLWISTPSRATYRQENRRGPYRTLRGVL